MLLRKPVWILALLLIMVIPLTAGCAQQEIVAEVNGREITEAQLDKRVEEVKTFMKNQGMDTEGEDFKKMLDELKDNVLDQLIDEELMRQEVEKRNLKIEQKEIDAQMQILQGDRSPQEFQKLLQKEKIKEEELKEKIKFELLMEKLYTNVTQNVAVTPQEVQDFYQKNKDDLVQVKVKHIFIEQKDENKSAEAAKEARAIIAELQNGADFASLAQKKSDDQNTRENGGLLDYYLSANNSYMEPEFTTVALKLAEGEFTKEPVKSSTGYHVIKVEDRKDSLEELKGEIEDYLVRKAQNEAFNKYFQNIKEQAKITKKNENPQTGDNKKKQ